MSVHEWQSWGRRGRAERNEAADIQIETAQHKSPRRGMWSMSRTITKEGVNCHYHHESTEILILRNGNHDGHARVDMHVVLVIAVAVAVILRPLSMFGLPHAALRLLE